MSAPNFYGIIDESDFSLSYPRLIDHGPYDTLQDALEAVNELIQDFGAGEYSIRPARYSKKHEFYVEDWTNTASIKVEVSDDWEDLYEEDAA